ncbi:HAD family hydrolase [Cohnella sp. GCM10020058]|uniref:HAD family hydrolase n=1 Tax=Cohnella sp. GCM10020058 TaxID=3317330 RepID=UPI00363DE515
MQYELGEPESGRGESYEGVPEVLGELKSRGVRLFVAGNGLEAYVKEVPRLRGIGDLFEGIYSAGEYATRSKVELVRLLFEQSGAKSAWMVGDRHSDFEAGKGNGLFTVGCDYAGFRREGDLDEADVRIASFSELLELLR